MITKLLCRILTVCFIFAASPAFAKWVYFDNSEKNWSAPKIHFWNSTQGSAWPGESMLQTGEQNIWKYDVPDYATKCLFHNGNGEQTKDFDFNEGDIYNFNGDTGQKFTGNPDFEGESGGEEGDNDPVTDNNIIYFDNTDTSWVTPHIHYWGGTSTSSWPGVAMTPTEHSNIWAYNVPGGTTGCLFNAGDGDATKSQDFNINPGCVYKKSGFTNKTLEEYLGIPDDPINPEDIITYTISFHNNVEWRNIYVHISGAPGVDGGKMDSFLNSVIFDYSFEAPKDKNMYVKFYTLVNGNEENTTSSFKIVNGHVYTISGDKGEKSSYDPNTALPEKEYWLSPVEPSQNDRATLYFNRTYNPSGPLHSSNDIYVFTGLLQTNAGSTEWEAGNSSNWENFDSKYKMIQSSENPDLFYIDLSPTIIDWYGASGDLSYDRIAIIFRDKNGQKQHADDQFIPLSYSAPVGDSLGEIHSYEVGENGTVKFECENGTLMVTPWSTEVVKVFTLRKNSTVKDERESISVINDDKKLEYGITSAKFDIKEMDDLYFLQIPNGVKVEVDKATALLKFYNDNDDYTEPSLIEETGLSNKTGDVSVRFRGMNDRAFYGGGYNGNLLNWDGSTMTMNNTQQGNWGQGASTTRNICIPFFVSTEGYGVYFDDHYRHATIKPSKSGTIYKSGSQNPIAYYYIGGGNMENVLQNYTQLTGLQELPPYWALGYITSKFSFATESEARNTISNTKNVDIPIDGIVYDIHWQTGSYLGTGTARMGRIDWDRGAFPDPVKMMKDFREENVHSIAITEPFFTSNSFNYDEMLSKGYFADADVSGMEWLSSEHVGLLDVTNPEAILWFKELYKKRTAEGIESWWLDLGEPEQHDDDTSYMKGSVNQVHNEYGNRWLELTFDALKEETPNTRFITMPRAGTAGMQRFNSFPWTGDIARSWGGLAAQVPALVSAAMSGVSYLGSDIGGFTANGTNADLYRRWVQLGVFYPSMRTHSQIEPEVWREAYRNVRDDVRDAINLRYAYLPYTYSQSFAYSRFGTPIARPANFNDNDKSVLSNEIGTYLWGPDLFVAPVLNNTTSKHIVFPEGDWLDMNNFETTYAGHSDINYNAPTNVLPFFMKRGSFVTRYRQDKFKSTAEINTSALTIDHFAPNGDEIVGSNFYDDDHSDVNAIRDEKFILTRFNSYNADNQSLVIFIEREGNGWENMPETQDLMIRVHDFNVTDFGQRLSKEQLRLYDLNDSPEPMSKIRRAPRNLTFTTPFSIANSEHEVLASTEPSYFHDIDNKKLYIRIPNADPKSNYGLELGQGDILTGTEAVLASSLITLEAGNGVLTYSASETMSDVKIEIFTTTGIIATQLNNLRNDGYAEQVSIDLASGVYIARLSATDRNGNVKSKTVKMIVK